MLLRLTTPGVPDLYQGTEYWDLSLVDPDNRRPVDFAAREASLDAGEAPASLLPDWQDGRVKLAILARALSAAREVDELLTKAEQADRELAARREGATYAGEADPYKKPRETAPDDEL